MYTSFLLDGYFRLCAILENTGWVQFCSLFYMTIRFVHVLSIEELVQVSSSRRVIDSSEGCRRTPNC